MQKQETVREYLTRKKDQFLEVFFLFQSKKGIKRWTKTTVHNSHYLPKYQKYTSARAMKKKWYEHIGFSSEQAFLFRELFRAKRGIFFLLSLLTFIISFSTFGHIIRLILILYRVMLSSNPVMDLQILIRHMIPLQVFIEKKSIFSIKRV